MLGLFMLLIEFKLVLVNLRKVKEILSFQFVSGKIYFSFHPKLRFLFSRLTDCVQKGERNIIYMMISYCVYERGLVIH